MHRTKDRRDAAHARSANADEVHSADGPKGATGGFVFLAGLRRFGHGLNLVTADDCLIFDDILSTKDFDQNEAEYDVLV
jgi:hypothetical protein